MCINVCVGLDLHVRVMCACICMMIRVWLLPSHLPRLALRVCSFPDLRAGQVLHNERGQCIPLAAQTSLPRVLATCPSSLFPELHLLHASAGHQPGPSIPPGKRHDSTVPWIPSQENSLISELIFPSGKRAQESPTHRFYEEQQVMISEIIQMEKEKYHTISLICESLKKRKNVIDTKMRLVIVTIGEGGWRWAK